MGPAAVKVAELPEKLEKMGLKVEKEIEIPIPQSQCWWDREANKPRCVPEIIAISDSVAAAVQESMEAGTIPITVGGDHSLSIGSIAGASNFYRQRGENFGLIWLDAHGDINTPETTYSGNVHGMPLAVSLGKGDPKLVQLAGFSPKVHGKKTVLLGIRDVDPPEKSLIRQLGIHAFTMRDVDHLGMGKIMELSLSAIGKDIAGLHVSFDLDVMDPEIAPGVSTSSRGGLNYREANLALTLLAETGLIKSIDIAELNPAHDLGNKTAELAVELIQTSLGYSIL